MKEDLIKRLIETFEREAEKYSNTLDGVVNYQCEEFFKKNNPENGYHSVDASIMFKEFTLKLEYKINISMLIPKSTVEMRFMFENGKLPVEYSIYDLLNIIDENNFKCYTFPYVTSESKMSEVLKYLVDTFNEYREKIQGISTNNEKITVLEKDITDKIDVLLNEKIFESRDAFYLMHMLELYYTVDISRFTLEGYTDYIEGNYSKAIKKYKRLGTKITSYERRLINYIKEDNIQKPVEDSLNTLSHAKKYKNTRAELLPMFVAWIILTPVWCVIYDLIFYIALYFLSKGAIYVGGLEPLMLFIPAFVTAIINSFFVRKVIYKIFFRKSHDEIIALDEIENSGKVTNMMTQLFQFVIALGIIFSLLAANTNITFYDSSFKNSLNLLDIKGETIQYADVECVYKADGIMNDFGQIVNNPTFVIVLKGGAQINLYYYIEFDTIKEYIIPIFEKHNIDIKETDLVDNIEKDIY